ncbi:hypothetical protein C5B42_00530, partial [Candidatus Cerribacteria bacterium 'Amazon FNV 2010 28 9']
YVQPQSPPTVTPIPVVNNPPTNPPQVHPPTVTPVPVVQNPNPTSIPASNTWDGSPLDLTRYCQAKGYTGVKLVEQDTWGWRCVAADGSLVNISTDDVCQLEYGSAKPASRFSNYYDAYSWKCYPANAAPTSAPLFQQAQPTIIAAPQGTPVVNALNTPLSVDAGGDLVYDVAYGLGSQPSSGQYIHVPADYHSVFLRTSPDSSSKSNVIATLNANDYFSVIQVQGTWAQIQTANEGVGWSSTTVTELGGAALAATNTSTPGFAPKYPDAQSGTDGINVNQYCKDIGYDVEQHSNADAYSFRCVKNQTVYPMDLSAWNKACADVWGSARPNATLSNSTELGAWKCEPNPGSVDSYRTPVQPTATLPPTSTQQPGNPNPGNPQPNNPPSNPNPGTDPCDNTFVPGEHMSFISYIPGEKTSIGQKMQCTDLVRARYPNLRSDCPTMYGSAGGWADEARKCGFAVNPQTGGAADPNNISVGDIAVWTVTNGKSCGSVSGNDGHVAIVDSGSNFATGALIVDEANLNGDYAEHDQHSEQADYSCMSFIHIVNGHMVKTASGNGGSQQQPGQPIGSGNVQSTGISWSFCFLCTSQATVQFQLKNGKYDLTNDNFTFNGATVTHDNMSISSDGTTDTITFHVSAGTVQQLKDTGADLNDLSLWHLFYTMLA